MKNLIKLAMMGLTVMVAAISGNAQTPYQTTGNSDANAGSTGLSITVNKAADLRSGGAVNSQRGATGNGGSTNNALNANLIFNNVTPSQSGGITSALPNMAAQIPLRLRSNATYQVKAFLVGGGNGIPAGTANSGDFKTGDIGFGVRTFTLPPPCTPGTNGCLVTSNVVQNDVIYNDPNSSSFLDSNGQSKYDTKGNLNYIGVGSGNATTIVHGDRISVRGDNTSTNYRNITLLFAIKPQYYTPATFTDTLKVFITTP